MLIQAHAPAGVAARPRPSFRFVGRLADVLPALRDYYATIGRA